MAYQSSIAIGSYLLFRSRQGDAINNRAYQNFFIAETRRWEGHDYLFAPFAIDGDQVSNALAGSRATLAAPSNLLTQAMAAEAVLARWLLEVKFIVLVPTETASGPVWNETNTVATDLWVCAGYRASRSDGSVQVELVAPLDAVEARTPNCVLEEWQVGSLPVTGSLLLS